jgi:adenine/guanine phosphoribosyltransferase-like PRPP-binding protein
MKMMTSYLRCVLEPGRRADVVDSCIEALRGRRFDAIAVAGVSGLTMGAILAHRLNKHLIVVRKDGESRHSSYEVEGKVPDRTEKILIVDDFMSSGKTVRTIIQKVHQHMVSYAKSCGLGVPHIKWAGFFSYSHEQFKDMDEVYQTICPGSWSNISMWLD